jgi:hypothetical protein
MTDDEIAAAFKGTDFGDELQTHTLRRGLLKLACGYYNGYTLNQIIEKLELAEKYPVQTDDFGQRMALRLTDKGKNFLYKAYEQDEANE